MRGSSNNSSENRSSTQALQNRRRRPLRLEELETRIQPSVVTGLSLAQDLQFGFNGYSPAQVEQAYGINQLNISKPGQGETIAIVDAYQAPNIQADVAAFDKQYNLPAINLTVVNDGATQADPSGGWDLETALDVEWAHAIAPYANIVLVEAANDNVNAAGVPTALLHAVSVAASQPNVSVVSMSWGVPEFSTETQYDSAFNVAGVTFVAAAGDSGSPPIWPAVSPYVVSVGGTTLQTGNSGSYGGETGWGHGVRSGFLGGSGGGVSAFEKEPAYQLGSYVSSVSGADNPNGMRMSPDVSYNANPNTGVAVYDETNGGWLVLGGTSAGTPQWAALVALADQLRASANPAQPALNSTQTLTALYQEQADFHDITSGNNGYPAGAGYDLVTGLGSPIANLLVPALAAQASAPGTSSSSGSNSNGSGSGSNSSSANFTVTTTSITATSGVAFAGTVATIADTDSDAASDTFTAIILWGDGTASAATITADPNGGFDVTGTHTYTLGDMSGPGGGCFGFTFGRLGASSGSQTFRVTVVVGDAAAQEYVLAYTHATVSAASTSGTSSSANQRFVTQAYQSLLGRTPDANGLAHWTAQLDKGVSRSAVVLQIEQSQEYLGDEVQAIYAKLLQRQADSTGLNAFTTFLESGGTVQQVEAAIAGSQEYFQMRGGGQTAGFLNALYVDALDRSVDSTGQTVFTDALSQGVARAAVAGAIFGSAEYQRDLVNSFYQTYLGRQADSAGLANFMAALSQGASNQAIIASLVGSQEFFEKL
jgi:hypothetical protein